MAKKTYYYNVKNRSASTVVYNIPDQNIRREFAPGEEKKIAFKELEIVLPCSIEILPDYIKPILELLSMIRNAYKSSHNFEKDGRHTVIDLSPIDEDTAYTFRYSVHCQFVCQCTGTEV